ncbi:hypothetical protein WG66_013437 [Moniliophthora roreri]|nr:hypothetical protein WG66_013437 [Moniliophthora roreri]
MVVKKKEAKRPVGAQGINVTRLIDISRPDRNATTLIAVSIALQTQEGARNSHMESALCCCPIDVLVLRLMDGKTTEGYSEEGDTE